ncbi:MAG TPA: zf-HC2 domain-containing protein, partial [Ardenticatenaceae bacterium]|nr:zf-HC2 domain-containing protein [Ardenticatenaceae bacterium]
MHAEWQSQLPFYVAGTLSDSARRAVESHLDGCQTCRVELREWRVVAAAVRAEAAARATALPA